VARPERVARVLGPVWATFVTAMAVVALPTVNSDAVWLVTLAAALAVAAAVASACTIAGRPRVAGALLVVAAVTAPTFGAVWLNTVPLLIGTVLAVRAEAPRPISP
jgi:hypothetical protein